MKTVYHFFRLIRTANLLVIGLTMFVVEVFLINYNELFLKHTDILQLFSSPSPIPNDFILLVISTLLIAAAGNIINDYFDVKADRINKPKRLIIDKHIKRRWAMVLHWSFNSLGLLLALYVGYVFHNVWIPLIAFISINILWFYSVYFKRKGLVGNLMVSLLLGIIPIYVLILNIDSVINNDSEEFMLAVVFWVSSVAFLMNLVRELVKDIQDIRGDLRLGAKTFPIRFGVKKTKWLIGLLSLFVFLIVFIYVYFIIIIAVVVGLFNIQSDINFDIVLILLVSSGTVFLSSVITTIFAKKIITYKIASSLLKVAMLLGLLTPLFF